MIDHLLGFASQDDSRKLLPDYWRAGDDEGPGAWRGDCCIPGVSVYRVVGTEEVKDPAPAQSYEREIREDYPGWFIVIALSALDAGLRDLPGNTCRLIADRDAAAQGQSFIRYLAPDMDPAALGEAHVSPTFAGSQYPFGAL